MFQTNFFCLGFLCKNSVVMHSVLRVSVLPQFLGLAALRSISMSKFKQLCLTKWSWDEERSWDERWRHLGGGQVPGARCLVRDASLPCFSLIGWANKFPFCPTPWNPNSWHPSIFLLIYIDHPIHLKTLSNLIPHSFINIKSFPKLWLQWSWSFSLSTTGSIYWESTMCPSSKNTVVTKFSNEHN